MNKPLITLISILVVVVLAGALLAACGSSTSAIPTTGGSTGGSTGSPTSGSTGSSTADGQTLMQQRCSVCHSLSRVTSAQKTTAQWKVTVDKMINNGAQLSPAEEQTLVNYLAQTYHP